MKNYWKFELLSLILLICNFNLKSQSKLDLIPPQVVKDTFYGKVYEDPYRFMEDTENPKVRKWMLKQDSIATNVLQKISNREVILAQQKKNRGKRPQSKYLEITENNTHFYLKKEADENLYKLYYRKGFSGKEELLFDPVNYGKGSENKYIINYIQPSWDASKIAVGFTKNDEEFSELVVLDVKTKNFLPGMVTNCWPSTLGGISWLKDNSGFFYTYVPVIDKTSEDYILNTVSVLYKLGSDPEKLNVVFSMENNPEADLKHEDFPIVYTKPYYNNILIGRVGGVGNFCDYYYSKFDNKGKVIQWKPLYKKEDKVSKFSFNGKEFYFLSAYNSPNFKLCKTSIDKLDFKNPEILVPEDINAVITDFAITKNEIYYVKNINGVDAQLYCLKEGKEQNVSIPKQSGYINVSQKSPNSKDFWIEISGWMSNRERYRYDLSKKTFVEEDLYPNPKYPELDDVVVEETEVVSHDGVKVPISIVYKKGTKLNGNNRVMIYGYGAYGYSNTPFPNPYLLHWVREGGIFAAAHVRGGGEKGDAWHKGGYKQTKPNTWKDFIACTEYLIKNKYADPGKIAVWSGSAGGILAARAITERPDLYKASIISAGSINMLRAEFGANGKNNIKEFGTVEDSTEFYALWEMDACQHLKTGTKYPAVLLNAGANDSRVPVWNSAKFAAGLQAANASDNPVLLSIDFGRGHGFNLTADQWDQKVTDEISFALWQTGHPNFQLKE